MVKIEKLSVNVTVEGDADAGERAFARLFDKFSQMREEREARAAEQAGTMAHDRALTSKGGRR